MLIRSLRLNNLLSFGPKAQAVELGALNVLIGPNGSGKSNFLEGLALLRAAPSKLTKPLREGGGVEEWLWKPVHFQSGVDYAARLEAVVESSEGVSPLRYTLEFSAVNGRFHLEDERIESTGVFESEGAAFAAVSERQERDEEVGTDGKSITYYRFSHRPRQAGRGDHASVDPEQSILSQWRGDKYPEITSLAREFDAIRMHRDWTFGLRAGPRMPQRTDVAADFLAPDSSNLGLVLSSFDPPTKRALVAALRSLYPGIDDVDVKIDGGHAQVFLVESDREIPATRLSDGTLRYLCLLATLCHPKPPPLLVIEEPELGLHPDVLPTLALILREASQRTQLVVTTHSTILVDALSDTPDAVLVCERDDEGTRISRLDPKDLEPWLKKFSLGELWSRGDIGGNRW